MGIYPISFAHWVLGDVHEVRSMGQPANDAVNGQFSAILAHVGGSQSVMNTTIMAHTPRDATIAGEHGYLSIPGPYYQPGPFTLFPRDPRTPAPIPAHVTATRRLALLSRRGRHRHQRRRNRVRHPSAVGSAGHPRRHGPHPRRNRHRLPRRTTVTVRVGVIGVGVMGADHARTLNGYVAGAG